MELVYYLEMATERLFAYGSFCEFFEMYDANSKRWVTSPVSYSRFLHDNWISRISREEAIRITGGILPEQAYIDYQNLFKRK